MDLISIQNDGPEIVHTDYWRTSNAARGYYYLSINAGAFRLLVPESCVANLREWTSAREVLVSRGPWPQAARSDALEILFEDDSDSPYALHLGVEQIDRLPLDVDQDLAGQAARWIFTVWTPTGRALALPCRYRRVARIPWLKTWGA